MDTTYIDALLYIKLKENLLLNCKRDKYPLYKEDMPPILCYSQIFWHFQSEEEIAKEIYEDLLTYALYFKSSYNTNKVNLNIDYIRRVIPLSELRGNQDFNGKNTFRASFSIWNSDGVALESVSPLKVRNLLNKEGSNAKTICIRVPQTSKLL